jgi:hypothetical protein
MHVVRCPRHGVIRADVVEFVMMNPACPVLLSEAAGFCGLALFYATEDAATLPSRILQEAQRDHEILNAVTIDNPRPFVLMRLDDETGLSGTGVVAWGVLFPDGKAVTRWCGTTTDVRQTCVWDDLEHVRAVHGHDGKTSIIWTDDGTEA